MAGGGWHSLCRMKKDTNQYILINNIIAPCIESYCVYIGNLYSQTMQFLKQLLSSNSSSDISIVESIHDAEDIGLSSLDTVLVSAWK